MEPEGSLPHSQVPATSPHPKPDLSSLNIILPFRPGSSKWSLSLKFPHQNPVYISPLSCTCYMPGQPHSFQFDQPNNIGGGEQIIKLISI